MKKLLRKILLFPVMIISPVLMAQNVGIGTRTPVQKLHVEGASYLNGNGGIGTATPQFPLTFNGNIGDKISLWSDGTATHYGFGIQGGLFQMFSKTFLDDIAFGYGSSTAFTERMRIKGNGNVGIGNADPAYQLDVSNRMRIRSGGNNSVSAGLWLNDNANDLAAFIGMEDDTHVGFYGNGTGWKFGMNTQTGSLKINGSEGQAGQILQSNGSGGAPDWVNQVNPALLKTQYYQTHINSVTLTNASSTLDINVPVTVYANSIITVSVTVNVSTSFYGGCVNGELGIAVEPLGGGGLFTSIGKFTTICGSTKNTVTTGEIPLVVSNGTMKIFDPGNGVGAVLHFVKTNNGPDLTIGNSSPALIIVKVIPQ